MSNKTVTEAATLRTTINQRCHSQFPDLITSQSDQANNIVLKAKRVARPKSQTLPAEVAAFPLSAEHADWPDIPHQIGVFRKRFTHQPMVLVAMEITKDCGHQSFGKCVVAKESRLRKINQLNILYDKILQGLIFVNTRSI